MRGVNCGGREIVMVGEYCRKGKNMTTTTKNGQISQPSNKAKPASKKHQTYNKLLADLNQQLRIYASLAGLADYRFACRKLKLPLSSKNVTTKQMSGYIGFVKNKIRELRK